MYFEAIIPSTDYEIENKIHIVEKDKIVLEKRLNFIPTPKVELKNKAIAVNNTKKKSINKSNSGSLGLSQLNFKYGNPFFVSLTREQKDKLNSLSKDKKLKHLVLHTYSNDNEIAIKRLENIYNYLPPKLRVNTIYKQDLCYEGNPCNTTNIKLIY